MRLPRRGPPAGPPDRTEIVDRTATSDGDADGHAKAGVKTGPFGFGAACRSD
jgi:hypothetical protein